MSHYYFKFSLTLGWFDDSELRQKVMQGANQHALSAKSSMYLQENNDRGPLHPYPRVKTYSTAASSPLQFEKSDF